MFVVKNRKIFYSISGFLVLVSIIAMFVFGFNLSIEFTGGTIIEIDYIENRPTVSEIENIVGSFEIDPRLATIQAVGESGFSVRTPFLDDTTRERLAESLMANYSDAEIKRVSAIGPAIGRELRQRAILAIVVVVIAIILFIAFAFRHVSEPVSSWKYGLVAVVTLLHDILIPAGIFAVLGYFLGYQLDVLFVTAILTILGYSVNDTIVVFDRVRENLRKNQETGLREDFGETVGKSLSQTYARSINTSLSTLLVLTLLLFVGGEATRHFALVLVIGIIAGSYSSIFLASPLLVWIEKRNARKSS